MRELNLISAQQVSGGDTQVVDCIYEPAPQIMIGEINIVIVNPFLPFDPFDVIFEDDYDFEFDIEDDFLF